MHDNTSVEEKRRKLLKIFDLNVIPTCDYCRILDKQIVERPNININDKLGD